MNIDHPSKQEKTEELLVEFYLFYFFLLSYLESQPMTVLNCEEDRLPFSERGWWGGWCGVLWGKSGTYKLKQLLGQAANVTAFGSGWLFDRSLPPPCRFNRTNRLGLILPVVLTSAVQKTASEPISEPGGRAARSFTVASLLKVRFMFLLSHMLLQEQDVRRVRFADAEAGGDHGRVSTRLDEVFS